MKKKILKCLFREDRMTIKEKAKFIVNFDLDFSIRQGQETYITTEESFIFISFEWSASPEGHMYWKDINRRIRDNNIWK